MAVNALKLFDVFVKFRAYLFNLVSLLISLFVKFTGSKDRDSVNVDADCQIFQNVFLEFYLLFWSNGFSLVFDFLIYINDSQNLFDIGLHPFQNCILLTFDGSQMGIILRE